MGPPYILYICDLLITRNLFRNYNATGILNYSKIIIIEYYLIMWYRMWRGVSSYTIFPTFYGLSGFHTTIFEVHILIKTSYSLWCGICANHISFKNFTLRQVKQVIMLKLTKTLGIRLKDLLIGVIKVSNLGY